MLMKTDFAAHALSMAFQQPPEEPSAAPFTQFVDGFQIPGFFSVEAYRSALNYKPQEDDVFIVTYPKCGTTWAQHILALIFRQGRPLESDYEQFFSVNHHLEMIGAKAVEEMPRPNAIKLHLPFHLTPWSDKAKYIYLSRNPKDCCVSYFHHMRNLPFHCFNGTFDQFFELFISGNIDFGDYFDHLLGWYAHRKDPNVLFMTYEEMKEDIESAILKIASFLDYKLYAEPLRNDRGKFENVIKYSSFDHMKVSYNGALLNVISMTQEDLQNAELPDNVKHMFAEMEHAKYAKSWNFDLVRKGITGDFKNYFSEEQNKRMNEKFENKTKDIDIPSAWKKLRE